LLATQKSCELVAN